MSLLALPYDSRLTSPMCVRSNRPLTIRADASLSAVTSLQLMIGVLIAFAALMISLIRGTPSVTFMDATPAKWNVFSVICVPGSPIDCAPTAPTVEPGSILALTYFVQHISRNSLSCSSVTLTLLSTATLSASEDEELVSVELELIKGQVPHTGCPHGQVGVSVPLVLALERFEHPVRLADLSKLLRDVFRDELANRCDVRRRTFRCEPTGRKGAVHVFHDFEWKQSSGRSWRN